MKKIFISVLLLSFLAGCSGNPNPGDSEIQNQVMPLLMKEEYKDTLEVQNLHKTNGYETNANTYTVDITYDVVFKVSYGELVAKTAPGAIEAMKHGGANNPNGSLDQHLEAVGGVIDGMALGAMWLVYGDFKAGDTFTQQQSVTFIKTENGWRLSSKSSKLL
jgi:hypothetical protein